MEWVLVGPAVTTVLKGVRLFLIGLNLLGFEKKLKRQVLIITHNRVSIFLKHPILATAIDRT